MKGGRFLDPIFQAQASFNLIVRDWSRSAILDPHRRDAQAVIVTALENGIFMEIGKLWGRYIELV